MTRDQASPVTRTSTKPEEPWSRHSRSSRWQPGFRLQPVRWVGHFAQGIVRASSCRARVERSGREAQARAAECVCSRCCLPITPRSDRGPDCQTPRSRRDCCLRAASWKRWFQSWRGSAIVSPLPIGHELFDGGVDLEGVSGGAGGVPLAVRFGGHQVDVAVEWGPRRATSAGRRRPPAGLP